jgi:molybdopterin-guanine dinucleotide biosynthesis protein B
VTSLLYVVGCKNAGKTRLIELLIPRLSAQLGNVGTVKYAERNHFSWEREGTDTHRHFSAGSVITSIIGDGIFALESRTPADALTLSDVISSHYAGMKMVLAESFASAPGPKIEVQRVGYTDRSVIPDIDCLATYGDEILKRPSPHFRYGHEEDLSDYIVANLDRIARVN